MGLAVLAGSIGWVARDHAARRVAAERVIATALEGSDRLQRQGRLSEALSAARRADELLAGADVGVALVQQVRARMADLELLDAMETVRVERETASRDGHFDRAAGGALYGQVLRAAGLDVEALPPEEAGKRIARTTVAVELAAVLDHWASIGRAVRGEGDPSWKRLLWVARVADPDPWRMRVREAVEKRDRQALREFAAAEATLRLPPATLYVLGSALLQDTEARNRAEVFLRKAQRQHPNDFWLNQNLYEFFYFHQPPLLDEAIRFAAVEVALRPDNPAAHTNLGSALHGKGRLDEAIAEYRAVVRLNRDDAAGHNNLGVALKNKGLLDKAIAEHREAIRLRKDFPAAHHNLGNALQSRGLLDDAIVEFRQAIRLDRDLPEAHYGLGWALWDKGQKDEAIAEYREAIRLRKDFALAHNILGSAMCDYGQLDEAIAEYHEAIRLKGDFAEAHCNLGNALRCKGQLDEAIAEYQEAIRLKKDLAEAHNDLGRVLQQKGQFPEALVHLRRGHELGSRNPRSPYPSAQWIQECERLLELDGRLPAFLSGKEQPADVGERIALARLCEIKKCYVAALRFYEQAFAAKPRLAGDQPSDARYNAACVAAMAGCGQGKDATNLSEEERAHCRCQALEWLRADLAAWGRALQQGPDRGPSLIAQHMQHWLMDTDLACIRGPEALARLPEAERGAWQQLWGEVTDLLTRSQAQAVVPKKPNRE
jgi:tetratricopeptide (TPR) repeat protein